MLHLDHKPTYKMMPRLKGKDAVVHFMLVLSGMFYHTYMFEGLVFQQLCDCMIQSDDMSLLVTIFSHANRVAPGMAKSVDLFAMLVQMDCPLNSVPTLILPTQSILSTLSFNSQSHMLHKQYRVRLDWNGLSELVQHRLWVPYVPNRCESSRIKGSKALLCAHSHV